MNKNNKTTEKNKETTITTEIKKYKNGNQLITLDYTFFKILKCYNKKKLFLAVYVEKINNKIIKNIVLSTKKPEITDKIIFLEPVTLQKGAVRSKSPRITVTTILKFYPEKQDITHITITDKPRVIIDNTLKNVVFLEFE